MDATNPSYCSSADGVLFNKDKTCLVSYPDGKARSYEIPNGVTKIGEMAFQGSAYLTSVTIPESVTIIGLEVFRTCDNLAAIYFKGNTPWLDELVFADCNKATIYYQPGAKGWDKEFGGRPTAPWNPQGK